jgi:hypothetical protein
MIALVNFMTQQQKHIIALNEYDEPALQIVYRLAYGIFTDELNSKVIQETDIQSFCNATTAQYQKIINNTTSTDSTAQKCIAKYAQDGISFANSFKRRCTGQESISVTPTQIIKSDGLLFVEVFIEYNNIDCNGRITMPKV